MTQIGGDPGYGLLFECSLKGVISPLLNFDQNNGWNPDYTNLIEALSDDIIVTDSSCTYEKLTTDVRGYVAPYKIKWSTGDTTVSVDSVTAAGTYSVSVTDARGITVTSTVTLPAYAKITIHDTGVNESCYGGKTGSVTATAKGGVGPYLFTWSTGWEYSNYVGTLPAGTYTTLVTDISGCKDSTTYTITQPSQIGYHISQYEAVCQGDSFNVGTHYYKKPGKYIDTVTNGSDCLQIDTTYLKVNANPVVNITGHDTILAGTKDTLKTIVAKAINYIWSNNSNYDTAIVSPAKSTTYYVLVIDSNGCASSDSIRIYVKTITSVNSLNDQNKIALYPIPAQQYLYITIDRQSTMTATISITDIIGNEIEKESLPFSNNKAPAIDISSIAPGIYFIRLNISGTTQVLRFIKQ